MAGDELLWQKVDRLKQQEPEPSRDEPQESKDTQPPGEEPKRKKKPAGKKTESSPVYLSDMRASKRASTPASRQESPSASVQASQIEAVRQVVKHTGKEITYVRLTPEEKRRLTDIVYAYRQRGIKTTENEISRVALNFLLNDYEANDRESVLARVIAALND